MVTIMIHHWQSVVLASKVIKDAVEPMESSVAIRDHKMEISDGQWQSVAVGDAQ